MNVVVFPLSQKTPEMLFIKDMLFVENGLTVLVPNIIARIVPILHEYVYCYGRQWIVREAGNK